MKALTFLSLFFSISSFAQSSQPTVTERIVSDQTHQVEIKLDNTTVLCSRADYSASFLKILIPELAKMTVLDHRNFGAGAPCVAAGMCGPFGEFSPDVIIDQSRPSELIDVKVVLKKLFVQDSVNKTCQVLIKENVFTTVRGIEFFHEREQKIGDRQFDDCL